MILSSCFLSRCAILFIVSCMLLWSLCGVVTASNDLPIGMNGVKGSYESHLSSIRSLAPQNVVPGGAKNVLTLDEISKQVDSWHDKISSIKVSALFEQYTGLDAKGASPSKVFTYEYAEEGDLRYEAMIYTPDNGATQYSSWDGTEFRRYQPTGRQGKVLPGVRPGIGVLADLLFISLHYEPDRVDASNPLLHPEIYSVSDATEDIDGCTCCVVNSGFHTMWFDTEHGYALRRYVQYHRRTLEDPGRILQVGMNSDFFFVDSVAWLPRTIHIIEFNTDGPPSQLGAPLSTTVFKDIEYKINKNVERTLFKVQFPPGAMVNDTIAKKVYYMPNGVDALDEAIRQGREVVDGKMSAPPSHVLSKGNTWLRTIVSLHLLAICIMGALWVRFRKR